MTEISNLKNCLSLKAQSAFKVIESYDHSEKNCEENLPEYLFELANNPLQTIKKYGNEEDLEIWQNILDKIRIIVNETFRIADGLFINWRIIWNNPKFNKLPLYIKARLLSDGNIQNFAARYFLDKEELTFKRQKRIIDTHKPIISR